MNSFQFNDILLKRTATQELKQSIETTTNRSVYASKNKISYPQIEKWNTHYYKIRSIASL